MNMVTNKLNSINTQIAIIVSRFNHYITNSLLIGALDILKRVGKIKDNNITVIWVPGAFEIPLISQSLLKNNHRKYDGLITLGAIIKGETKHFKYIADHCCQSLSKISLDHNIPIGFGILITKNVQQAIDRAGMKYGNKGSESALAILETINIIKNIKNK
ncbi:MAG: 6,7-dimethyl-8-ribityllumazine synthase [Arsenophonus sp.]|nr:MAG: 6,7-dimethyl-8-ribityllumazine synthase [Arsenophonus sp.]